MKFKSNIQSMPFDKKGHAINRNYDITDYNQC